MYDKSIDRNLGASVISGGGRFQAVMSVCCPKGVESMKVIICGAGQVGWQIARHLSGELNDVTVVDNNPDLVRRATETLDVQGIAGFASAIPTC